VTWLIVKLIRTLGLHLVLGCLRWAFRMFVVFADFGVEVKVKVDDYVVFKLHIGIIFYVVVRLYDGVKLYVFFPQQ
jgi:hypothetical protein